MKGLAMLVPKKKIVAVSVSAFLMLTLSGCSNFITLKESTPLEPMYTPRATTTPEPVFPDVTEAPPEFSEPIETVTPTPVPHEEYAEEAPPEFSQPVETEPATPPVPPEEYDEVIANDENSVRLRANDTLDRIAEIATSPSYQKLIQEAEAVIPTDNEPGNPKLRAVIANNQAAMDEIHQVFSVSDTALIAAGAVPANAPEESRDSMRDIVVLNRFVLITGQLRDKTGFMEVSPGAIIKKESDWYFKSDDTPPKAIVVLKGTGSNDYHFIRGFEGFRLESGGKRFVMAG